MQDDFGKVNILLVDDEPANLLALEAVLEDLQENLVCVNSGEEALRCLLKHDFAVVLLDVKMPGMDGFEAATLVRQRDKSRRTPIIFLTGMQHDVAHVFRGYEIGAVDYMLKPIVPEILKSKVAVFVELYRKTREIKQQEKKYRNIFQSFPDIYFRLDMEGNINLVSPSIHDKLGYQPHEVIGRSAGFFFKNATVAADSMERLMSIGVITDCEFPLLAKDGRAVEFSLNAHMMYNNQGDAVGMEGVLRDITERKEVERLKVEESKREQGRILQSILDSMGDGVVVADRQGNFLLHNPAAEQITGFSPVGLTPEQWAERYGAYLPDMSTPYPRDELPLVRAMRGELIDGAEIYMRSPGCGSGRWLSVNGRPLRDGDGALCGGIAVFRDVTENKLSEQRLAYLAQYDPLTGLPNRNLFRDRLTQAMARASRNDQVVALMFLDLDNFKNVNDTLGHAAGDLLLKSVAERLTHCVRQTDTVARLGGDEFTVILEGRTDMEHVIGIAQEILEALLPHFMLGGQEIFITTSIGIVMYASGDALDVDTLIKNADTAMYRAKGHGRNNYQVYTPEMHDKTNKRLVVENNLRRALERDELIVYYQPQLDLKTGTITGVEALLRWQPFDSEMLFPSQFLELAEETGLIVAIGEWVLGSVCRQNKAWQDAGLPPLRVAVNFSARQMRHANFIEVVKRTLDETGLEPQYLDMEITEGQLMENIHASTVIINELKDMGVYISVDDFGTGYSSLSYLKHFPLDILKMDQSFVRNITSDPSDAAIATTIIALAQNLQFKVIAEGVETKEQLAFLREKGCHGIQGFLFSHPLPAAEITQLLLSQADMEQDAVHTAKFYRSKRQFKH